MKSDNCVLKTNPLLFKWSEWYFSVLGKQMNLELTDILVGPDILCVQSKNVSFPVGSKWYFSGSFFFFPFLPDVLTNKKSSFSCSDRPISERVTVKTDRSMSRNSCFPNTSLCHAKSCSPFSPAVSAERLCCPLGLSPPYTGVCAVTRRANCPVPFNTHKDRRQWHPTPVLLPGKSHGRRSLEGCSPWGH